MSLVPSGVAPAQLAGETIAFSGRLSSMSRKEARALVARLGGSVADDVNAKTTMLVVGAAPPPPPPLADRGHADADDERDQKVRRAKAINARDPGRVRILAEEQFCRLAGVPSPADLRQQWYAVQDILVMYPRLREDHLHCLQKWNLIRPALRTAGETYFPFPDLSVIRQAHAELERGAPFRSVLRSLQASREGQLSFDFRIEAEPAKVIRLMRSTAGDEPTGIDTAAAEEFFRTAAALDDGDARNQAEACGGYRRALEIDPYLVPALINLANIHYAQEHLPEAEALYERAIALDPSLFEAHFNLGNVLHDVGRLEDARAAYEAAVDLNERYAEAHFYLAVTLEKLGRAPQARLHWRRYRELAPNGEWVQLAGEFDE